MAFSLSHIEVYVSDLKRSEPFWHWLFTYLGYELCSSWLQGRSWQMDGHYFCIVQAPDAHKDAGYHRCRPGLNHLAFSAGTTEEVDALRAALIDRNVPLLYEDRFPFAGGPNVYGVFFEDPERIKIEVVTDVS